MKRTFTVFILALAAAASAQTSTQTVSPFDQAFLRLAAQGNQQEILLGQLAQTNSQDTNVQNFGAVLVNDHSNALFQVQTIAANLGVTLPQTNVFGQALVRGFTNLTGPQFDQQFIQLMIRTHTQDFLRYENAAFRGQDPDVRAYARTQLPVLADHLATALTIRETLPSTSTTTTGLTGITGATGTTSTIGTTTTTGTGGTGASGGGNSGSGGASVSGSAGGTSGSASASGSGSGSGSGGTGSAGGGTSASTGTGSGM